MSAAKNFAMAVRENALPLMTLASRPVRNFSLIEWRCDPLRRRILAFASALLSYALIVLTVNFQEIVSWHHIIELIYPALGAAWGVEHVLGFLAACFVYRFASTPPDIDIYADTTMFLRGRQLIPYQLAFEKAKGRLTAYDPYLWWGQLPIHAREAVKNFLIVGRPGSGKSVAIELLLRSIVPAMGKGSRTRMLLYDAKSDFFPILTAMNPNNCSIQTLDFYRRDCVGWDMARDIRSPDEAKIAAAILVPETPGGHDKFFSDYARLLFQGVMESFILSSPEKWTFRDVLLALKSPQRMKAVLSRHPETRDILANLGEERTRNNVFSTVQIERQRYSVIAATWHKIWADKTRRISLSSWIKGESILLMGQATAEGSPMRGLNQLVIQRIAELLDQQPNSKTERTWLILDELTDLQYVRGLDLVLRRGRSKGVACVLGFQTWPGMIGAFKFELASQITALCSYKSFLAVDDPATAQWAAAHFGNFDALDFRVNRSQTVGEKDSTSNGRSLNTQYVTRPSVMPEELLTLPPTNEEHGFTGYHLSPQFKDGYKAHASWSWTLDHLTAPPEAVFGADKWSEAEKAEFQYLTDWTDAECQELGLPTVKEMDSPENKPTGKPVGDAIKKIQRNDLNK